MRYSFSLKIWNGTEWDVAAFSVEGTVNSFNGREGAVTLINSDVTIATGVNIQTKVPEIDGRLDVLEDDATVIGSVDNKIELRAQDAVYDDDNGLGTDTIKEALDKLVLDLYKVKEW